MVKHYQAVIIGFGKAGKTLAAFLAKKGWRVALIERSEAMYGGTCINIGCIPSKALVHDAEMGNHFSEAMRRKSQVVRFLRGKNYTNLESLEGVDVIHGFAAFKDEHTLEVSSQEGSSEIRGEKVFINTGASSIRPNIPGLDKVSRVYDSTALLGLDYLPKRLGIIGAGYIGVEFASIFAQFGSQVTLFDSVDNLWPREDTDVVNCVKQILVDMGVKFVLGHSIQEAREDDDVIHIVLDSDGDPKGYSCPVDALLLATGRRPCTEGLNLESIGVEVDAVTGKIKVDSHLRSSVPHIWALGDVNGGPQFTYISLDDFRIIRDQLFGEGVRHIGDRKNIPYSVFLSPPLSRVGLTESQASERSLKFRVVSLPVAAIPKARVMNDTRGVIKILVDDRQRILGAALLCLDSHEIINILKLAMDADLPYTTLRDQIFTHPSMSESLNDLLSMLN